MIPGTKFRLTGRFLRSTGQIAGGEGAKVWTVFDCGCSMCASGRYVACAEEDHADVPGRKRHFALSNVSEVGKPTVRDDP